MRVLQIAPRLCWPLDTGAKLRNYHLGRVLAKQVPTSLLAFRDRKSPNSISALERVYEQVITVPRDAAYSVGKILRGGFGSTPLPVLNYTTESMRQSLERLLAEKDFDLIQIESIHLMSYLATIRAARNRPLVVCDWHNVESELIERYSQREKSVLRKRYARRTARLMSDFERRALVEFDAHVVVSARDAERLRAHQADVRIFVVENGVDTAWYSDVKSETEHLLQRLVFVGSMDYHANIDGAISFAREVWPEVHAHHPELVFSIVGKDPPPEVRELARTPGIEVTGTVDDVRPFYREAIAAVVPLNVGGGSRLKILEAMAAGVPVVSTTLGAEGLEVTASQNILIADTNLELVEAIDQIVENQSLHAKIITGGRTLISERYDWSSLGVRLFQIYQELVSTRSSEVA
jgi:polysaccharide biosynthesis protein PslH